MRLYSKFQKRMATLAATAIIATTATTPLMASDYENHWAKEAIERWQDKGVVNGYEDGTFKPKQAITRAELAKIIVEIFGLSNTTNAVKYTDVSDSAWYAPYVAAVSSAGIMNDSGKNFKPNQSATREEAAYAIAVAYKVSGGNAKFKDSDDISSWAAEKIGALAANGYVSGRNDGKFAPKDSLTRADVITMIDKITADLVNKSGTYTKDIKGNLVVKSGDVNLKDMVVDGNLYIAEGVGEGDVTLDNVTVKGTVFLEGAGENSFKVINGSKLGVLKANKANGKPVRILVDKNSSIKQTDTQSKCILDGAGTFETVNVMSQGGIQIKATNVGSVAVKVETTIELASTSTIGNLICSAVVTITGNGTITKCEINVTGCKLSVVPKETKIVGKDVKVSIGNKEYTESNISTATNNSSTSNTSSSNTSGSSSFPTNTHRPTPSIPNNVTTDAPVVIVPNEEQKAPSSLTPEDTQIKVNQRNIVEVKYQNTIFVPEGMEVEKVLNLLPNTVEVNFDNGTTETLNCSWSGLTDVSKEGTYEATGKVTLPSNCNDTDGKLNLVKAKIVVESSKKLMGPAAIVLEKTCLQSTDDDLKVTVTFPKATTTESVLHVQIKEIDSTKVTQNIPIGITTTTAVLKNLKEIPGGFYSVKGWVTTGSQISAAVEMPVRKLGVSQVPKAVNGIQELREALYKAVDELQTQVTFDVDNLSLEELNNFKFTQYPILSECLNGLECNLTHEDGVVKNITYTLKYKKMYEVLKAYKDSEAYGNKISTEAKESLQVAKTVIGNIINDKMTDYEKEKAIHDYIVANTAYSKVIVNDITNPIYGVEGVLLNKVAVCQGYAETMKMFMDMLNIECKIVTGTGVQNGKSVAHAWNLIKLDNEWYHVDATWDDPTPDVPNRVKYGYFNVTDDMIKKDHVMDGKGYEVATGTKYFYYAANKVNSLVELNSKLDALIKNSVYEAEIYCDFDITLTEFQNALVTARNNNGLRYGASIGNQGKLFSYKFDVQ